MPRPQALQPWQRQGLNRATAAGTQGQYLQAHPGVAQHQQRVQQAQQAAQRPQALGPGQGPRVPQQGGFGFGPPPQGSGQTGAPKAGGQAGQQQYQQMQQQQAGGPLAGQSQPGMGQAGFAQNMANQYGAAGSGQSNMAQQALQQQGGYNPPWGQPGSQQWNNYLQQQDQAQKAWMAANPGQGNPFMALQQGNVQGNMGLGQLQSQLGAQMGNRAPMQNMGGAVNMNPVGAGPQQMNQASLMQALQRAFGIGG